MPIILAKQAFQFGLLGHLDILLLVNKQWGYCLGTRDYTTRSFPISFSSQCYALVIGYCGQTNDVNNFHEITGIAAYIISKSQFKTGLWESQGTEKLCWVAAGK